MSNVPPLALAPSFVRAIDEVMAKPENAQWHDLVGRLRERLTTGGRFRYLEYHDILCLFLHKDRSAAVDAICSSRGVTYSSAEPGLMRVLNNGHTFREHEIEALYDRGIIKGVDRFFVASKGIEKGSLFDSVRKKLDPVYDLLISNAIEQALKINNKGGQIALTSNTLKYVPVLLMEEGTEKADFLNQLRAIHKGSHASNMSVAHNAIFHLGKSLNIALPEVFRVEIKPMRNLKSEERKPETPVVTEAFAKVSNDNLRDALIKIVRESPSLKRAAQIYMWMQGSEDGKVRMPSDATKKFGEKEVIVSIMCSQITKALNGSTTTKPDSNGDLHQPAPVGP